MTADTRGATTYNYRTNNRGRMDRLTIGATVTADYSTVICWRVFFTRTGSHFA